MKPLKFLLELVGFVVAPACVAWALGYVAADRWRARMNLQVADEVASWFPNVKVV